MVAFGAHQIHNLRMGVDHTAFAVYGIKIDCTERDSDKIDEAIPSSTGIGICEWGSRPYGGSWGYLLTVKGTYQEVDFDRGVGIRALSAKGDLVAKGAQLVEALEAIQRAGIKCKFDGEPSWFVGGTTW